MQGDQYYTITEVTSDIVKEEAGHQAEEEVEVRFSQILLHVQL